MSTVRAAVFQFLRSRGITTVFGNPGSTELGFLADFPSDFRYVLGLHEGVAIGMADGYSQINGVPSFVNLHSACGVGNAMGAVVNAFHNRAPIVITAGNQDRRHLEREPYLFARSAELMAPYVKSSRQPGRAADVPAALDLGSACTPAGRSMPPICLKVPGLELPGVDFVALAAGLGCPALRVTAPGDLPGALAQALRDDRPWLVDVAVDPVAPPLLPPSASHDLLERA